MKAHEFIIESYQLDEGLGDWIEKKMDQLLSNLPGPAKPGPVDMSKSPANIPDDVAEKLVADFMAKKENQRLLQQAAYAQKTTIEKIKPYLMYFVGGFVDRWKQLSGLDKRRILQDLAMGVFKLLMFILEAMIKSKR